MLLAPRKDGRQRGRNLMRWLAATGAGEVLILRAISLAASNKSLRHYSSWMGCKTNPREALPVAGFGMAHGDVANGGADPGCLRRPSWILRGRQRSRKPGHDRGKNAAIEHSQHRGNGGVEILVVSVHGLKLEDVTSNMVKEMLGPVPTISSHGGRDLQRNLGNDYSSADFSSSPKDSSSSINIAIAVRNLPPR